MDKLLKQLNKIKKSTSSEKYDYQKYIIFGGIILTNGIFVLPAMKKIYLKMFSNYDAEMSHMVKLKNNPSTVLFRYRAGR